MWLWVFTQTMPCPATTIGGDWGAATTGGVETEWAAIPATAPTGRAKHRSHAAKLPSTRSVQTDNQSRQESS